MNHSLFALDSPTSSKMIPTAFRASSSALQHTIEQQFCRCGSPLLAAAQPRRRWSSIQTGEVRLERRRGIASRTSWSQQLEQSTSSSGSRVAAPVSPGIPPAAVASPASPSKTAPNPSTSRPARREIKAAKAAIHLVRFISSNSCVFHNADSGFLATSKDPYGSIATSRVAGLAYT